MRMIEVKIYDNYPHIGCDYCRHVYSLHPMSLGISEAFYISIPETVYNAAAPLENAILADDRGMPVVVYADANGICARYHPNCYGKPMV